MPPRVSAESAPVCVHPWLNFFLFSPPPPSSARKLLTSSLFNGKIINVDERFTVAQAVAIRGDRFTAFGSTRQITTLAGPSTRRIDLHGRAVVPGLIDNHTAPSPRGGHVDEGDGTMR